MRHLPIPAVVISLRARLVVAFAAVVAIALLLVLASLPRLLDGYFAQQAQEDLRTRAGVMGLFVVNRLLPLVASEREAPRPILLETDPPTASDDLRQALGTAQSGFVRRLAQDVAQANVTVTIAADPSRPRDIAYRLLVTLPDEFGAPGQQREPLSSEWNVQIPDTFWAQTGAAARLRLGTVRLSEPFTYRAQTLETIVSVMIIAAGVALVVAVVLSIIFADRLTHPIRQLTGAARELSEGHLDVRVTPTGAPE
ncbi:MAG: HAMP domain-containing protein, partial [Chloroflexota bacterium]|nr:HAMP domain-containing protein [Chloroflexota bacterium]